MHVFEHFSKIKYLKKFLKDLYFIVQHLVKNGLFDCLKDHPHIACVCSTCKVTVNDSFVAQCRVDCCVEELENKVSRSSWVTVTFTVRGKVIRQSIRTVQYFVLKQVVLVEEENNRRTAKPL